jgi:trigger factor
MKVSVETTSNLGRKLTIEIPSADVEAKKQIKLREIANTIKMDGFRKGKVPESFLKQRYSKQIHRETVVELIESSLKNALNQEKLIPVDLPGIEEIIDEQGKNLQYVAKFEVFPEIELVDFKTIQLDKFMADIVEEDVDKGIESLKEQFATWIVADKSVAKGDKVVVDFVGSIDGVPFKNGDGKNIPVEIGSEKFIPGFEEGLIGVKAGEKLELAVTFPDDYGVAELAGKSAIFSVTVHTVENKELAKVDEEFAKKIGIQDGDTTKIRDKIKANMEKFISHLVQEDLRNKITDKLMELSEFDIPVALFNRERNMILEDNKKNNPGQKIDMEKLEEEVRKKIKLGLILNKIIKKYDVQANETRMRDKITELSSMFGGNVDLIKRIYKEPNKLLDNVKNSVLTDQALDLVIGYATINDISSTFYDIANRST